MLLWSLSLVEESDQIMTLMNKPLQTGIFKGMKFDSLRVLNQGNANL